MARYIKADDLAIKFRMLAEDPWNKDTGTTWSNAYEECADNVDEFPTADVVEVKHGEWYRVSANEVFGEHNYQCTLCQYEDWMTPYKMKTYRFCPNCGAKMDGKETEDE